jgi:hypothetical protein
MHLTGEHYMFPELHMTRDPKSSGNGVITTITFLSDVITKEATQARVRFKFGTLMWRKSDITNKTKDAKQGIVLGEFLSRATPWKIGFFFFKKKNEIC